MVLYGIGGMVLYGLGVVGAYGIGSIVPSVNAPGA